MKWYITLKSLATVLLLVIANQAVAQVAKESELFKQLSANDSLLFEVSFNKCQLIAIDDIIADDLEFYHDQGGITNSKKQFMEIMNNGICNPTNKTKSRRELVKGTLEVFPLYQNGELYGALQSGEHRFFESYNGQQETKGSIAKFSHLWLKDDNNWILKRVISYDHKSQTK